MLIRPLPEGGIVMQQLLYADEVRPFSEVPLEKGEVKEQELALAKQLIDQISTDEFKPEKYEDDVHKRVEAQIQRKVEGQEIQIEPAEAADADHRSDGGAQGLARGEGPRGGTEAGGREGARRRPEAGQAGASRRAEVEGEQVATGSRMT